MTDVSNTDWSVTDGNNTQAPPDGWPVGMAANQVRPTAQQMMGALKRLWERAGAAITTTGSAGAYIYTPTNTLYPTEYVKGDIYAAIANFTSVGGDTININGLGARKMYKPSTSGPMVLAASDIQALQAFLMDYDPTLDSGNGGVHVLAGLSQSTTPSGSAGGDLTGTYPNPNVKSTHLTVPLPLAQGGTNNTTGAPSGTAGGDLTGTYPSPTLAATAVVAGSYTVMSGTVDAKGRLTAASSGTAVPASASQAQMETGTVTTVYASPGTMKFSPLMPKAWASFDNAGTINGSSGVTSVTRTAAGKFDVVLIGTYTASKCFGSATGTDSSSPFKPLVAAPTAITGGATPTMSFWFTDNGGNFSDPNPAFIQIFGDFT